MRHEWPTKLRDEWWNLQRRLNAIDRRSWTWADSHLLELAVGRRNAHFPPVVDLLVHALLPTLEAAALGAELRSVRNGTRPGRGAPGPGACNAQIAG